MQGICETLSLFTAPSQSLQNRIPKGFPVNMVHSENSEIPNVIGGLKIEIQQNPGVGSPTTTYTWQPLQGWFIKRFINPGFVSLHRRFPNSRMVPYLRGTPSGVFQQALFRDCLILLNLVNRPVL